MQKRLFTFGCSFTRYKWPTWADALAPLYDSHQNWAQGGAGNSFILYSLSESHARHGIAADDTVIIMWSSRDREDRYDNGWQTPGATVVDEFGSMVRDCANMHAARLILDAIGCTYHFLSMIDIGKTDNIQAHCDWIDGFSTVYADTLSLIKPSVHDVVYQGNWHNAAFGNDYHPTPQQHIDYLDEVLPNIEVDGQTRLKFAAIEKRVRNGRWTDNEHWHDGYLVDLF